MLLLLLLLDLSCSQPVKAAGAAPSQTRLRMAVLSAVRTRPEAQSGASDSRRQDSNIDIRREAQRCVCAAGGVGVWRRELPRR
jgi:hypothetical protein